MKSYLFLCIAMIGCMPKSVPPVQPQLVEVTSANVPVADIQIEPPPEPVVHTWITGEELKALEDERLRQAIEAGTACNPGDPLCDIIE